MKTEQAISSDYIVKGHIWIDSDKGPFLGFGRIQLLKKVKEYGSISQAAKSMNIAYRRAWHLIESMNAKASSPLVITQAGGKGGGGAQVTGEGLKMIRAFEELDQAFSEFMQQRTEKLLM